MLTFRFGPVCRKQARNGGSIDGLEALNKCGMGLKECSDTHLCPLHDDIKQYQQQLPTTFREKTMQDLVDGSNTGRFFITNGPEPAE
jgi:hypothetical protein